MRIPLLATLLLISTWAFADEDVANGLYGGLFVTGSSGPSLRFSSYKPEFLGYTGDILNPFGNIYYSPGTLSSNFGAGGGMNLGYRYNCFRFEGEFLYNVNTVGKMKYAPGTTVGQLAFSSSRRVANTLFQTYVSGQTDEYMGFANFFYDFLPAHPAENSLYPYVGLGFGYQKIQTTTKYKAQDWVDVTTRQPVVYGTPAFAAPPCPDGSTTCLYTPTLANTGTRLSATSYVGQGILGVGYEMDSYFNFYLDFRYIATPKLVQYGESLHFYTFNLGMNYLLSGT
jgi:hypothetical protein